jgi:hypothetical protein
MQDLIFSLELLGIAVGIIIINILLLRFFKKENKYFLAGLTTFSLTLLAFAIAYFIAFVIYRNVLLAGLGGLAYSMWALLVQIIIAFILQVIGFKKTKKNKFYKISTLTFGILIILVFIFIAKK